MRRLQKEDDILRLSLYSWIALIGGAEPRGGRLLWDPLPESRREDEDPDSDGGWKTRRKWTNLRDKVRQCSLDQATCLLTTPQSSVIASKEAAAASSLCHGTDLWSEVSHLSSGLPSGSASPLRFDHSFDKVTVENKKPISDCWTQKSQRCLGSLAGCWS